MARLGISAQTGKLATTTTAKTLLQLLAATNQRVVLGEISISFDGTVNTNGPILVELVRQTSAGTMSALTISKVDPDLGETIQTVAKQNASAEPTDAGDVPFAEQIHPQQGLVWQSPWGMEFIIPGAGRLGLRVTAGVGVNAVCRMKGEE